MEEKELKENVPEKDIEELLQWWHQEENAQDDVAPEEEATPTVNDAPEEEAAPEKKATRRNAKTGWQGTLLMYLHDLVYLLSGLILVFLLLFRVVIVSGTSMNNTLLDGDYLLLLSRTFYQDPQPGDVIVASKQSYDNGAPIVKRVIATEGQWVSIDFTEGVVYVGDSLDTMKPLDEPYTMTPTNASEGIAFPLQVSKGCLFVMGDNRNGSKDSRHPEIGLVDKREVLGKVVFLFVPGTNEGETEQDFGRIGVVD